MQTGMRTGRVAVLILLAALIAVPVAYMQLHSVVEGTDLMMTAFGGDTAGTPLSN